MRAGDCAAFPAGVREGHCLQNRSAAPARVLATSNRSDADGVEFPGLDLVFTAGRYSGPNRTRRNRRSGCSSLGCISGFDNSTPTAPCGWKPNTTR